MVPPSSGCSWPSPSNFFADEGTKMSVQRYHEIKDRHLGRSALVYVRQSSDEQVEKNQGSTEFQRSQADHARSYGWPDPMIIEADLGLSGAAAAHRPGYQFILREVQLDHVGAIFVSDTT